MIGSRRLTRGYKVSVDELLGYHSFDCGEVRLTEFRFREVRLAD